MSWTSLALWRDYADVRPSPIRVAGVMTAGTRVSDRVLVERLAGGDETALRELYEHFSPTLYAVTCRILQDRTDTEEVVAESFAQAWREAGRFSEKRGSVAAWLTMIARSRAIDAVRARRRRDEMTDRVSRIRSDKTPGLGAEIDVLTHVARASNRDAVTVIQPMRS